MRVLVGGGTGFIGRHLQSLLRRKGYDVTVVSRTRGSDRITWNDLRRNGLPEGCGAVVNLAGENLMNPLKRWNDSFKSALISSRVDTSRQLVEAITAAKSPPKVWVSASAIGFYPPSKTETYTEDSPGGREDFLARLCFDWEKAASLPPSLTGVRHVTVRFGIALGRDGGTLQKLYLPFKLGLGGHIGSGKQWFPWIHVDDVSGIIVHAIENDKVTGILNAVAPETLTNAEFTSKFAKSLCRKAIFPVPAVAMRFIYGQERADAILKGQRVIPKRTLESGYQFLYPELKLACREFSTK